jgi:hypothetical protein
MMTQEHEYPPRLSKHAEAFRLTEREDLYDLVSDARFRELLECPDVDVVEAHVDTNSYGEYLFVTLRRQHHGQPYCISCYGLGFHEQREQWITDHWRWYSANLRTGIPLSKQRVLETIQQRQDDIMPEVLAAEAPSQRALWFSLIADFTDEDGALSEIEDLDVEDEAW